MTPTSEESAIARAAPLLIAAGLALGPATVLGLGRFGYALLLPAMRRDLHWSYAQAGAMNTANAVGYLAGALVTPRVIRLLGVRRTFLVGLILTTLTLPAMTLSEDTGILLALRLVAGVCGALAFISGATLATHVASDAARPSLVLAVYFAGPGLGIVLSSLAVPYLLELVPGEGWRLGWLSFGALGLVATGVAVPAALRPSEPSTRPVGAPLRSPLRPLAPSFAAYTLFGVGYIAYMTFIIAYLRAQGAGPWQVSVFWAVLGMASVGAVPLWGFVLARAKGGWGTSTVLLVVATGAGLPLLSTHPATALASAALFGGSFLAVVTAVTAVARRALPPHLWSGAIAALTVSFSVGQSVGPTLAGALSDTPTGISAGLVLSVAVLVTAALAAAAQRHHVHVPY